MRKFKEILAYAFYWLSALTALSGLVLSLGFLNPVPIIFLIIPALIFGDIAGKLEDSL